MSNHFRKVTKKDDTISRKVAIKVINYVRDICGMDNLDDYRNILVECFKVMPPAHSEQKTGKWIFIGDGYKCSECKSVYSWWADSQTSNYCPNCGTEMSDETE